MPTYFIDEARIHRITGSANAIPWRPRDEGCNLVPPCARQNPLLAELSRDGVNYAEVHRFPITWD